MTSTAIPTRHTNKRKLKRYALGTWYSLPVQLFLLHFKKYQALLLIWYILFSTVGGSFMNKFGAHMLFLYPEYLGKVNAIGTFWVGCGFAVFLMCWNITTFILHSREFKFLAATAQPFLKYCINNAILPLLFIVYYLAQAIDFTRTQELLSTAEILALSGGFLAGLILVLLISFLYFFGADKTIYKRLSPQAKETLSVKKHRLHNFRRRNQQRIRVDWYFSATMKLRQPRNVSHYDDAFLERIFSQHHLAAIFSIMLVFALLVGAGFLQDNPYLQLPAAGSIMVFFAILIALVGGFSYFAGTWSLPILGLLFLGFNYLYQQNIFDPRNKAYGVAYNDSIHADYNEQALMQASAAKHITADSLQYIQLLNNWKKQQGTDKPVMILIASSGGGMRAATFTSQVLQQLDSVSRGQLLRQTFLMTGASGGMLGAAWIRELYHRRQQQQLSDSAAAQLVPAVWQDLLNPLFSSFVTRDLMAPAQFFSYAGQRYIKDRGYAFEQKLNSNTMGWLDKPMLAYKSAEASGQLPHMILNAVITRDGRTIYFSNHSVRFFTKPQIPGHSLHPDGIDFNSFFRAQHADSLRFLSALRMNATFPYVLPNVWMPTSPVIDVMDAGFRDNTGLETAVRFVQFFRQWLQANCSKVLILQIRDKLEGGWDMPYESSNMFDLVTKPALLTQNNLFRFQEYEQLKSLELLQQQQPGLIERVLFEYKPNNQQSAASLSFHLTRSEQQDIVLSIRHAGHVQRIRKAMRYMQPLKAPAN